MAASSFNVLAADAIFAKVKFDGGNSQGPQLVVEFPNVMFRPTGEIALITEEWGTLEMTGEVLIDETTGFFGTITHPDGALVSPLTSQYYIGKGIISVQVMSGATPDVAFVDIGNVPAFTFEPNIETLPHFSSRVGVRSKDLEVITEKSATLTMTMEEFTARNLQLAFMGVPATP